jgi:uncharacterized membrane protein
MTSFKTLLTRITHSPICYKLSIDLFLFILLFTAGFFLADLVLPGILSTYVPVSLLFATLGLLLIWIGLLARWQHISFQKKNVQQWHWLVYGVFLVATLLLTTHRFPLWTQLTIIVLSIIALYTIARTVSPHKHH